MDNALTPNKILRLLHYAEDKSFSSKKRMPQDEGKRSDFQEGMIHKSSIHFESSSGILDLEKVEGFGEDGIGAVSLSKSTAFNPGEMTGRSTGADDIKSHTMNVGQGKSHDEYGRHSFALENLASNLDKQTMEVNDIMRHSIATNYSFHSKKDLTAEEASFVFQQAPLPVQQSTQINITTENTLDQNTNMSMGSYFKNRCPEFRNIFIQTDSPDRSARPSITEVSQLASVNSIGNEAKDKYKMDQTLDCIPVRQSRGANNDAAQHKETRYNTYNYTIPEISDSSCSIDSPVKKDVFKLPINKAYEMHKDSPKIEQNLLQKRLLQSLTADQFLKKAHPTPFQLPTEESSASVDNDSLSISKIADYLGKQSNVSVSGMLQFTNQKQKASKKQPLTELHMNLQNNRMRNNEEITVTSMKDIKKIEMASSAGTISTVLSLDTLKINSEKDNVPATLVSRHSLNKNECNDIENRSRAARSKSPSSKSPSTLSTVQENITSFKSNDSPLHSSKGEVNLTHIPSPNVEYKELDNSVDWYEVLQHKHLKREGGLAKEQWAEIRTTNISGYVGTSSASTITITTLSDSWLTAKFQFVNLPDDGQDLTIELPRQPLLLSPGKTEQFTFYITCNVVMNTTLSFILYLKDASIDGDIEQNGSLELDIKMPIIQALSCDGINKVSFPPIHEHSALTKFFVIVSDCPVDLQLDLSIIERDGMFIIKNVQEISKNDVSKVLMERDSPSEEEQQKVGKAKGKILNKQLCRLASGNAIRVSVMFIAPKLAELNLNENMVTFKGALNINLIGIEVVLKKVDLYGVVGSAKLDVDIPPHKLHISNEPTPIILRNLGCIAGSWFITIKEKSSNQCSVLFQVSSQRVDIRPGSEKELSIAYVGSQDELSEGILILEDIITGKKTAIDIAGGTERPKMFPIKTTYRTMSWVRAGRKELNLRNSINKKIQLRCHIIGDGFSIDLPGMESRGTYCLSFGPDECRPLPIMFAPTSTAPHAAALHLVYDKNSDFSRKVMLFGCASGESIRWSGLVTYGDTALVRAVSRQPVTLTLYNKYNVPAFICARVNFNLQYRCCEENSRLEGAQRVIAARRKHAVALRVDWARVERRARSVPAGALAALTVLAGPELTRRRILRIIRNKKTGELDTSLLPDRLRVLAQNFEGQDVVSDESLKDFEETITTLNELFESLQELTAQIGLPQDFTDENTIIITDDTVLEHHTLCD